MVTLYNYLCCIFTLLLPLNLLCDKSANQSKDEWIRRKVGRKTTSEPREKGTARRGRLRLKGGDVAPVLYANCLPNLSHNSLPNLTLSFV